MKTTKIFCALVTALVLVLGLTTLAISHDHHKPPACQPTPIPDVVGPIPVTAVSHPYMNSWDVDLASFGYVEQEFFVSGTANVYDWPVDNQLPILTPNLPYTDRILVRRPANPHHFSGSVIVEPIHPIYGGDAVIYSKIYPNLFARGDAWVGINQPSAVAGLQLFDPERYEPLSVPSVTCPGSPPAPNAGVLWDIISQVGALLKSHSRSNPLAGFRVEYLYLTGYSQTGGVCVTYLNNIHRFATLHNCETVYDGYVLGAAGRSHIPINACATPPNDGQMIIKPSSATVIQAMTQEETVATFLQRRPDSNHPGDRYRRYEVAGASHFQRYKFISGGAVASPEDLARAGVAPPSLACLGDRMVNNLPYYMILQQAFDNLDLWVREGIPAPRAPLIEVINGGTPEATIVYDEFGNALGGLRTPYVDVPTATYYLARVPGCSWGDMVPFDHTLLKALYRNHGDYVHKVIHHTNELLKGRWVSEANAAVIKTEAAHADVP